MPINAHPEYLAAEKEYLNAEGTENKLKALEKMISHVPKHKGAENLRAQLKTRYKKLKEQIEKSKKSGKKSITGIKKESMQAVIIGETNAGKSTLLTSLTNARPKISKSDAEKFTTKSPIVGMMDYQGVQIQIIEVPATKSEFFDKGIVNSADTIIILVTEISQIPQIKEELKNAKGKQIVAFNKKNKINERKISSTLQSKKYNFEIIDSKSNENIEELKEKIFQSFNKIRVYTKHPNKKEKEKNKPVVLEKNSTVRDIAEKIFHGLSNNVKESLVTGPSAKFPNQKVSLNHKLADKDTIEFKLK